VSASLSVDVAVVVDAMASVEVTVEITADVMLEERARRVHHLESSLLSCTSAINLSMRDYANIITAVDSVVVLVVEEPVAHHLLLKFALRLRLLLCSLASTSTETSHGILDWLG